jgi:hypothetical protein
MIPSSRMLSAAPRGAIADEPEYTPDSIEIYQDWRWFYTAWWTIFWLVSCRSEELPKGVEHHALGSPTVEKESNCIIGSLLDGLQLIWAALHALFQNHLRGTSHGHRQRPITLWRASANSGTVTNWKPLGAGGRRRINNSIGLDELLISELSYCAVLLMLPLMLMRRQCIVIHREPVTVISQIGPCTFYTLKRI